MNIHYKVESSKSFEETVTSLKETLMAQQFGVLWELNFKDKLKEKGLEFDVNFKIMEACNPSKAKRVLEQNIEAGYFLPCKVVVYEADSKVYMGMLKPTTLIGMIDDARLISVAEEVEEALTAAIEAAK